MARRTRFEAYLSLAAVAGVVGFYLGKHHADPPGCEDVGECHLGTEVGLATAALALALVLLLVGAVEFTISCFRRRQAG